LHLILQTFFAKTFVIYKKNNKKQKARTKFKITTSIKKAKNAKYLVILAKYFKTMQQLLQVIEKEKLGSQVAKQHTLIIDDKQIVHGALFMIKTARKTFKLMIPAPFHEEILKNEATISTLIKHPHAMLLS